MGREAVKGEGEYCTVVHVRYVQGTGSNLIMLRAAKRRLRTVYSVLQHQVTMGVNDNKTLSVD